MLILSKGCSTPFMNPKMVMAAFQSSMGSTYGYGFRIQLLVYNSVWYMILCLHLYLIDDWLWTNKSQGRLDVLFAFVQLFSNSARTVSNWCIVMYHIKLTE